MTANAVVAGSFADIRTVKSRSVVVLMIEVPIERAAEVVEMFGFPQPGAEVPVAVARLVQPAAEPTPAAHAHAAGTPRPTGQKWDECLYAKQVSTACGDPEFREWLRGRCGSVATPTNNEAVTEVKRMVGIRSRKELDADPEGHAVRCWNELYGEYKRWRSERIGQEQAEAQARAYGHGR